MKLTKDQRFTAYVLMLEEMEKYFNSVCYTQTGLCFLVFHLFGIQNNGFTNQKVHDEIDLVLNHFPEVEEIGGWHYCWPKSWEKEGIKFRKKLLKKCIIETSDF